MFLYMYVYIYMYLVNCLFIYSFIYLFIYLLFIYLFIYFFVSQRPSRGLLTFPRTFWLAEGPLQIGEATPWQA